MTHPATIPPAIPAAVEPGGAVPIATPAKKRGAVLIIVLVVLSTLSLLAFSLSYRCRVELRLSQYQYERAYTRQLAQAGLVLAMSRLAQQGEDVDYLGQPWHAGLRVDTQWLGRQFTRFAASQNIHVECMDEESKVNLLSAPQGMLQRVPGLTPEILASIQDWSDADEIPSPGGAESAYYQTLPNPYRAKNKPLEDLCELLLIKGVTPQLYYGAPASAGREPPRGLVDLLTVCGGGDKINLNTAPLPVVLAIPGLSERSARQILRVRDGADGVPATADDHPFRSLDEVRMLCHLGDFEADIITRFCRLNSSYFRMISRGEIRNGTVVCQLEMYVHRVEGKVLPLRCTELNWK